MEFLAGALIVFWLVVFVFVYSMVRRQQALEQEIRALREAVRDDEKTG